MGLDKFGEVYPFVSGYIFTDGEGTNPVTLAQNNYQLTRADIIIATSTSITDHVLTIGVTDGSPFFLGSVNVPAGAGHGTVPAVDVLAGLPSGLAGGIVLPLTIQIQGRLEVALLPGETLPVGILGGTL